MGVNDAPAAVTGYSGIDDVQVFQNARSDRRDCVPLLARFKVMPRHIHGWERASILGNANNSHIRLFVGRIVLRGKAVSQCVGADLHLVSVAHRLFFVLVEGGACQADDGYDYTKVHDVSAITAGIAVPEVHKRREKIAPRVIANNAGPPQKLRSHGRGHQDGQLPAAGGDGQGAQRSQDVPGLRHRRPGEQPHHAVRQQHHRVGAGQARRVRQLNVHQ